MRRRFGILRLAVFGLTLLAGCDYIKMLNLDYNPMENGAPKYTFARQPRVVICPYTSTIATRYGPYHVGEFLSTFGTLEDRAFAEATVFDVIANAMTTELEYGGLMVYDERHRAELTVDETALAAWCAKVRARHPDADFAVGGIITKFWSQSKSFFWSVRVKAEVEFLSYVIDLRAAKILLRETVNGKREGAEQYVGAGRMKILLQEAMAEGVGKTLRNPQVVEAIKQAGARTE